MGLAVAHRLGQDHRILLVDIDNDRASRGATELAASGIEARVCACDVTSQTSVQALADKVRRRTRLKVQQHRTGNEVLVVRLRAHGAHVTITQSVLPNPSPLCPNLRASSRAGREHCRLHMTIWSSTGDRSGLHMRASPENRAQLLSSQSRLHEIALLDTGAGPGRARVLPAPGWVWS